MVRDLVNKNKVIREKYNHIVDTNEKIIGEEKFAEIMRNRVEIKSERIDSFSSESLLDKSQSESGEESSSDKSSRKKTTNYS